MSQKKNEGILFSAEIRVVGSYTDRLLTPLSLCFWSLKNANFSKMKMIMWYVGLHLNYFPSLSSG